MANAFQLKGRLFTLSVLSVFDNDLDKLKKTISEKVKQAPKFFQNAPIVLDLSELDLKNQPIDFKSLKAALTENKLIPVGIKGLNEEYTQKALEVGLAKVTDNHTETRKVDESIPQNPNLIITHPIRSGQQVYAQGGDLIILSSISPGAELLADGNIHVYGTLRGRVLAGVNGDETARVFCHRLEAELISIAGHYKVFEDLNTQHDGYGKQISLDNAQLIVSDL